MIRNRDLKSDLVELNHRLDMIQTVLLVSNPDSPMAADAYNGLRRTIVQSLQATQALQAAIAQLDSIASATDDIEVIRLKLGELLAQYGVTRIEQFDFRPDAFERIGAGPAYTVTKPAYAASPEMPPIQLGVAETTGASSPPTRPRTQPPVADVPAGLETSESPEPHGEPLQTGDQE